MKKLSKRIKPSSISFKAFLSVPSALTKVTAEYKHHWSVLGSISIPFKHLAQGRHGSRMIEPDIGQNNERYLSIGKYRGVVFLLLQISTFFQHLAENYRTSSFRDTAPSPKKSTCPCKDLAISLLSLGGCPIAKT